MIHLKKLCKALHKLFRKSETDLQIRSVYHRRRDRIESHICISFMAYLMYKELERLLHVNNLKTSVEKAIEQINKIFEIIIPGDDGSQSSFRPHNNPLQQRIIVLISSSYFWVSFAQNRKELYSWDRLTEAIRSLAREVRKSRQ